MEKIIYAILKEIKENENRLIKGESIEQPNAKNMGITPEAFDRAIKRISEEKLADVKFARERGMVVIVWFDKARILEKGENYLKEHSLIGKTYKGLKEIREWLNLIK